MAIAIADPLELYVVEMINAERADAGLQPVHTEVHLNSSAQGHSDWMGEEGVFSHTGENGSAPSDRAEDAAFPMHGGSWKVTENVAYSSISGPVDEDELALMHSGLMNSPSHQANILDPDVNYIGVGLSRGQVQAQGEIHDVVFLTQNFGTSSQPVLVQEEMNGETVLTSYVDGEAVPETSESLPNMDDENAPASDNGSNAQDDNNSDQDADDLRDADTAAGGSCFVATAAYGSRMHPDVVTLRRFRDEVLVRHQAGRAFIRFYWIIGPRMAKVVRPDHLVGHVVRLALSLCVAGIHKMLKRRD